MHAHWHGSMISPENTDLQQAAELNSTRNVKASDVYFHWRTFSNWFWYTICIQ